MSWKALLLGALIFAAGTAFGACVDCGTTTVCPEVIVTCPECAPDPGCPDCICPACPDPAHPCIEIPLTIVPPAEPTAAPTFRWDVDVQALLMEDTDGLAAVATWHGRRPHRVRPTFGVAWLEGRDFTMPTPTYSHDWRRPKHNEIELDDQWGVVLGVTIGIGRN